MRVLPGVAWLAVLVGLSAAPVASRGDLGDCESGSAERAIAGCTRIIENPRESRHNRALAHERRGLIHLARGAAEQAIADFSAVLRDEPERPLSLYARGMARIIMGDAAGQNEMEVAIMLRPGIAEEFKRYGIK
jgi:hypothetical protein